MRKLQKAWNKISAEIKLGQQKIFEVIIKPKSVHIDE